VRTLIIVPAYNEEAALPGTLTELRQAQPGADIAVVDDGSRDETSAVAHAGDALVLQLPFNLGVGAAVRTGLRCAASRGYERAIVVDADGQHDPAGVAELLAALDAGADLVIGSRFAPGAPEYATGRVRRRAMRLLQRIVRVRTGQDLTDVTSGYRGFSRPVIELLAAEYPAEFLADTVEAILIVHDYGGTIVEVPVPMRARAAGTPSTRGIGLVLNYLRLLVGILSSTVFPRRRAAGPRPAEQGRDGS
jgi:glycosyltransferase involved in cell wall biosynthesis